MYWGDRLLDIQEGLLLSDTCGARDLFASKWTCTDFTEDGLAFESDAGLPVGGVALLEFRVAGDCLDVHKSLIQVVHRS
jgi:hypothetical protein